MTDPLLEVRDLKKEFGRESLTDVLLRRDKGAVKAVDGVSFDLEKNDSVAVIGESGCGKTTLLHTLAGLQDPTAGEIVFKGKPVADFDKKDWKEYRRNVQIIFQDPFNALDPKLTVKESLREPLGIHGIDDRERRVVESLEQVNLRPAEGYLDRLPSQLSGGEKQRVSIARALIVDPDIILADEPVSMLDVSTQSAILNVLADLVHDQGISLVYISHDLSTVSYVCDEIMVMYLGRVVERSPTLTLLEEPKHPYAQALIDAVPIPHPKANRERTKMEGTPRDPIGLGEGCRFRDRCPERMDICEKTPRFVHPSEDGTNDDVRVACHLYYDHDAVEEGNP